MKPACPFRLLASVAVVRSGFSAQKPWKRATCNITAAEPSRFIRPGAAWFASPSLSTFASTATPYLTLRHRQLSFRCACSIILFIFQQFLCGWFLQKSNKLWAAHTRLAVARYVVDRHSHMYVMYVLYRDRPTTPSVPKSNQSSEFVVVALTQSKSSLPVACRRMLQAGVCEPTNPSRIHTTNSYRLCSSIFYNLSD